MITSSKRLSSGNHVYIRSGKDSEIVLPPGTRVPEDYSETLCEYNQKPSKEDQEETEAIVRTVIEAHTKWTGKTKFTHQVGEKKRA